MQYNLPTKFSKESIINRIFDGNEFYKLEKCYKSVIIRGSYEFTLYFESKYRTYNI